MISSFIIICRNIFFGKKESSHFLAYYQLRTNSIKLRTCRGSLFQNQSTVATMGDQFDTSRSQKRSSTVTVPINDQEEPDIPKKRFHSSDFWNLLPWRFCFLISWFRLVMLDQILVSVGNYTKNPLKKMMTCFSNMLPLSFQSIGFQALWQPSMSCPCTGTRRDCHLRNWSSVLCWCWFYILLFQSWLI